MDDIQQIVELLEHMTPENHHLLSQFLVASVVKTAIRCGTVVFVFHVVIKAVLRLILRSGTVRPSPSVKVAI